MIIINEADHRKFPRRDFSVKVRIHDPVKGRDYDATALDINPMGMALESKRSMSEGEVISLRFPSPEGDYQLAVQGQVVRASGKHLAIEFFDLEDWIFEELCAYVYDRNGNRPLVLAVGAGR